MPHERLHHGRVAVAARPVGVHDPPDLLQLGLAQLDLPGAPVLLEPVCLGRAGDGNDPLRGHPGQRDLAGRAALAGGELLDLVNDGAVLVEVLALVLGSCARLVRDQRSVRVLVGGRATDKSDGSHLARSRLATGTTSRLQASRGRAG